MTQLQTSSQRPSSTVKQVMVKLGMDPAPGLRLVCVSLECQAMIVATRGSVANDDDGDDDDDDDDAGSWKGGG